MLLDKKGVLIVLSGPAGSGKGTVVEKTLEQSEDFDVSISLTTRPPRGKEQNGVEYHFVTREDFEARIAAGKMMEYATYCNHMYGTDREWVERTLESGKNVILEIEVQGALQIKQDHPEAVLVMILPPSYAVLEARLRGRKTNTEADIRNRLEWAKTELTYLPKYDYVIENEEGAAAEAAARLIAIARTEQHRAARNPQVATRFFES